MYPTDSQCCYMASPSLLPSLPQDEEFRFEVVDDSLLQNTPVEFKVIDQDLYSSELIGVVYIDLNPLIMRTAHADQSQQKDLVIEGRREG